MRPSSSAGTPEDVASVVPFPRSPDAEMIGGQTVVIDEECSLVSGWVGERAVSGGRRAQEGEDGKHPSMIVG